jgi:acyl-CoA dehydrogenase
VREGERLTLARAGGSWRLSGTVTGVPWGAAAHHLVAVADGDGTPMIALVGRGAGRVTADRNLALEPRDTLVFDGAAVVAAAPAGAAVDADVLIVHGAMIRAAQMAGAVESLLEQSVRYVTERKQFGKPIGSFQAIQHNLAIVAGHVAAAGIAAEHAFRAADRGDPVFEVAVAKVRAGEAAGVSAGLAHQAHGAIGFTYEHSLHFSTRRLWSWRAEFGSESRWALRLGRHVAAAGADRLWSELTAR